LNDVVTPVQAGSVLEMQTGLFNLGRNRALHSGTTEPRPEDILALKNHARAMAKQTYRDKYNPAQNVHDAMHETEYRRTLAQREEAEKAEQHAAANLRDAEDRLARTPKAGPKPHAHPSLVAAFVVAITLTVAPTLHDSIFLTIGDDLLNWFGSLLGAAFVGVMLTLAILSGRRTKWTWIGVVAGVILGVGLGAVRLSAANGAGETMVAVGLTIMEIAAVLLLESHASGLRTSEAEWFPRHSAETEASAARDACQSDLARWQARVKELSESITNKIAFVADRHNRNIRLPELEAVAIKAVLDGYNAGTTENIGRLRGVPRRAQ
jgi:plasmid stabilization system protein ParE